MIFLGGADQAVYERENMGNMKAGVWIGIVCVLLWLFSFVQGILWFTKGRGNRRVKVTKEMRRVDCTAETLMEHGLYRPVRSSKAELAMDEIAYV